MEYEDMLKRALKSVPVKSESRFEIPEASVRVEKRQTVIKNFADIAKVLRRKPAEIAKYLFKELAVPGSMRGSELVLQAKLSRTLVNQRIKEYAKEFVMCKECGKPDTALVKEGSYVFVKCEACGARRPAKKVR